MARIPTASDIGAKPWRVIQAPAAIKVGATSGNDPTTIGSTVVPIGLTDGGIEWNPNVEGSPLQSDQLYNPYGYVETMWNHQITFQLDQMDIWNIALAMSYDQDAVAGSSILCLTGQQPSPYRSMQVITQAPPDGVSGNIGTQYIEFFKCKILANGAITYSRTAKSGIPLIVHALANSNDEVGRVVVTNPITKPAYE